MLTIITVCMVFTWHSNGSLDWCLRALGPQYLLPHEPRPETDFEDSYLAALGILTWRLARCSVCTGLSWFQSLQNKYDIFDFSDANIVLGTASRALSLQHFMVPAQKTRTP